MSLSQPLRLGLLSSAHLSMARRLSAAVLLPLSVAISLATFSYDVQADSRLAARLDKADAVWAAKDWPAYRDLYQQLSQQSPQRGEYAYRLGRAQQELGAHDAALQAYAQALTQGYRPAQSLLRMAVIEAGRGRAEAAVAHFEAARRAKLVNAEQTLLAEPELKALLADPRWRARLFPQQPPETDRPGRWRADIDFLDLRIRETHWHLFEQVSPAAWDAALTALRKDLDRLADWQISLRLMEIVRLGRSGHTHLLPPFQGDDAFHAADLRLQWFAEGLFVTAAPPEQAALVGRRVLRVGSGEPEQVLGALRALVPHDSASGLRAFAPVYLLMPEVLMHYGFARQRDRLPLTLETANGQPEQLELPAPALSMARLQAFVSAGEAPAGWPLARSPSVPTPRWLSQLEQPFWLNTTPQAGLLYAQLNAVRDGADESLADFAGRLQQALRLPGIEGLVLDLRHNRGGNGELLEPLVQALTASPQLQRRGGLYVLTSGRSFSAAALLIGDLERQLDPVFVGEPSGAGPTHVGEDNLILLPNTGLAALAASRLFVRSFSDDGRDSLAPHLAVAQTFADWRAGRDAAWEAVLADRQ